ncbi:SRPBCC family protein [Pleomorphovibrio marinus]|uniref:SRPBCC family protein n=1 Tax=Pleomorphovibrio marinus TaxID=2164132 RepID=UPI000E0AEC20|nr:SRPBCC domain-containing protein [Pleomorphovibrio marinus]
MERKQFKTEISAPVEKVVDVMLGLTNKSTYEQWTSLFNPTSTFEGSWEKGEKIYFIGTDDKGNRGGMVARIAENIPNQFVSIQHYGILDGDKEFTEGPQVEQWAGGQENYIFEEIGKKTKVTVEVDVSDEHSDYFDTTYPKALEKLKEIAEAH